MTNLEIANQLCAALINKGCERVNAGEPICLDSYCRATLDMADILPDILEPEWTPVTEALPPEDAWVLASVRYPDGESLVRILTCVYTFRTVWEDEGGAEYNVSAWAPLPIPYGGEENGHG